MERFFDWATDRMWPLVLAFVLLLPVFVLIIALPFVPFMYIECERTAAAMGREYEWDFWAGCFFEDDSGRFVADENWGRIEIVQTPVP